MILQKTVVLNSFFDELRVRAKIGLFMALVWQLVLVALPPIKSAASIMIVTSLVDVTSMVVINRFCGERRIGRDINELTFYGVLLHIIAIPAYYYTEIPVEFHNNGIWILFIVSIGRLAYFGKQTEDGDYKGLPAFGLLACIQKVYAEHLKRDKKAFHHWSEVLFFGSAAPLWFIMWRTNDQSITITVIGLMVFIYLVTGVLQKRESNNAQANGTVAAPIDVAARIAAATQEMVEQLEYANAIIKRLKETCRILLITIGVILFFGWIIKTAKDNAMFNMGYAAGYTDSQNKEKPKMDTDFDKLARCYSIRGDRYSIPPSECRD
jgi:hypothetical protein